MTVNDYDEVLAKKRLHCRRLYCIDTNGDEALPEISPGERMSTGRVDHCIGHLDGVDNFRRLNTCRGGRGGTQGEAAGLLRVSLRTIVRRYGEAIDSLTHIFLEYRLLNIDSMGESSKSR